MTPHDRAAVNALGAVEVRVARLVRHRPGPPSVSTYRLELACGHVAVRKFYSNQRPHRWAICGSCT